MADSAGRLAARPLSPHLQVWRWHVTLAASILHRFTGMGLYAGLLILSGWAVALAGGAASFDAYSAMIQSPLGLIVMFGVTLSAFFHLANGIRHLAWDLGFGFQKQRASLTAWIVIAFAVVAAVGFWFRLSAFGVFGHG